MADSNKSDASESTVMTTVVPNSSKMAKCLAETMGSFIFGFVIFASGASPAIAIALFLAIVAFGPISGGHFNPAVSAVKYANGDIDLETFLNYLLCQLLGFFLAWAVFKALFKQVRTVSSKSTPSRTEVVEDSEEEDD
jgi:glycerol uptake facilitator-like aquaporin